MTNKKLQLKVHEQWNAGWNTLTFEEQFKYHLKSAGHVKPVIHRNAGKFFHGGVEFDVEAVDMPDVIDEPKTNPFVFKSHLTSI